MSLNAATLLLEQFDHLLITPEAVEELNQAILTLAVQGKLVEQDTQDEPASELLKRIAPQRHLEGLEKLSARESEKLFELPKGWVWVRLGTVIELISGQHILTGDYNIDGKGTPYLTGPADFGNINPIVAKWTLKPKVVADKDDILITVKGAGLGKLNIVAEGPIAIGRQLMALRPFPILDKNFLYHFLKSKYQLFQSSGVGIAIPGIDRKQINNLVLPLPPLAEQKRIVARVEALFAQTRQLAEKLTRAQQDLAQINQSALAHLLAAETPEDFAKQWDFIAHHFDSLFTKPEHIAPLRQAILELAVRGKLTRREATDEPASELLKRISQQRQEPVHSIKASEAPFELPDSWAWTKLNEICRLITDGTHYTPRYLYDGVPFLSVKDVSKGFLDFSDTKFISEEEHKQLSARCKPELGDILLTKVGTTGIAVIVDTDKEFSIFVSIALLKFFQQEVLPNYLSLVINSPFVKRQSAKYTMGVGNKNLVLKYIKDFLIPLPPLAEQQRIVAKVEQLLGLCDALEAKLRSAREERIRLTAAVLAGVGNGSRGKVEELDDVAAAG